MAINLVLDGVQLTHIRHLSLTLTFRSGLHRRDPNALAIQLTRDVGLEPDAPADQLTFKTLRGEQAMAGVNPKVGSIQFTDDNVQKRQIGEWKFGAVFVEDYTVQDEGLSVVETTTLRANEVTYRRSDGPDTTVLDVNV